MAISTTSKDGVEKRGTPKAVLLSIRDYIKLAAPWPMS